LRIIYYFFATELQIWLMTLYGKHEADDLTSKEKKALKAALDAEIEARAQHRAAKRGPRRPRRFA
jgi:hypothetical protein